MIGFSLTKVRTEDAMTDDGSIVSVFVILK
jgi:hypothetical protein